MASLESLEVHKKSIKTSLPYCLNNQSELIKCFPSKNVLCQNRISHMACRNGFSPVVVLVIEARVELRQPVELQQLMMQLVWELLVQVEMLLQETAHLSV